MQRRNWPPRQRRPPFNTSYLVGVTVMAEKLSRMLAFVAWVETTDEVTRAVAAAQFQLTTSVGLRMLVRNLDRRLRTRSRSRAIGPRDAPQAPVEGEGQEHHGCGDPVVGVPGTTSGELVGENRIW